MAYISINPNRDAGRGNSFSVNGSDPVRIYTTALHRLPDGECTVVIRSANGECWECEGDLNIYRSSSVCMNIRLAVDAAGDIVDVEYAVFPLNFQQEGAFRLGSSKLKLTYTQRTPEPEPEMEEEIPEDILDEEEEDVIPDDSFGEEDLDELLEEEEDEAPEPVPAPDPQPIFDDPAPPKKGGAGLIVFGILCLLAAAVNTDKLPTLIACGALGVICLLIGIKKKKG